MDRSLLRRRVDAGFTLIELLIVIVILGILAAIVVFSVTGITSKGDTAACKSQVATIDTAFEANVAQGGSSDPTAVTIGTLYTKKFLHGTAPVAPAGVVDGNAFDGSVTVATVDGYTCA